MMPYIKKERRRELSVPSNWPMVGLAQDVGELNYQITCLVDDFISRKKLKYSEINSAIGVLECAKMELYRRIAAPYEDEKCKENGDVYSIQNIIKNRLAVSGRKTFLSKSDFHFFL